ncbi:pro-epidermal growth factor-like [Haliotis cracherodii]|uniref:pro-epidermal growth factor-like n=1 Tax=Haliotis cracherodii TaxID=6455 RepID=UPI0039E94A1E
MSFRPVVRVAGFCISLAMASRQWLMVEYLALLMLLGSSTPAEVIVLITDYNGYIYKMDKNSQGILYHDQQGTEDIAYDPVEEQIYWSNLDTHSVSRVDLDGGSYMKLFDVQKSQGIVLDPSSRILFYSDDRTAVIGKYHLKTRVEELIVRSDLSRPHALAADTQRRKLYWSDIGNSPRIEMADYNGNDREIIVQSHLIWPTSLVLDKTVCLHDFGMEV